MKASRITPTTAWTAQEERRVTAPQPPTCFAKRTTQERMSKRQLKQRNLSLAAKELKSLPEHMKAWIEPSEPERVWASYRHRDKTLREMGYASYAEYLCSPLWKGIRRKAFFWNGTKCRRCKSPATEIHHADYKRPTLQGTVMHALIPVCRDCHKQAEFEGDRKTSHGEANAALGYVSQQERRRRDRAPLMARKAISNAPYIEALAKHGISPKITVHWSRQTLRKKLKALTGSKEP